jgi:hypothetical protein
VWYRWRIELHPGFWWGHLIDGDQWEDLGIEGGKLAWILKKQNRRVWM